MKNVVLVDYGVGNLLSVARALEHIDASVELTSDINKIENADRVILPGVGAFGHCMDEIRARGLDDAIMNFVAKDRPLLGICVGMQVLHTIGKEFGEHKGLGLIGGVVDQLPSSKDALASHKIPYVGWAKLKPNDLAHENIMMDCLADQWFYFVHGFMASPEDKRDVVAYYVYNDINVVACTGKDNIIGTQFHPEKSAEAGLHFLKKFISI